MNNQPDQGHGPCVIGIDAAWSTQNHSGAALMQRKTKGWQCLALAPSYDAFIGRVAGQPGDQSKQTQGSEPDPEALLKACDQPAGMSLVCDAKYVQHPYPRTDVLVTMSINR